MSFYVTLPSDSSLDAFPLNSPSNFMTLLNKELKLDDGYQVALVEIALSTFKVDLGHLVVNDLKIPIIVDDNIAWTEFLKQINLKIIENYHKNVYENDFESFKTLIENSNLPNFKIYNNFVYLSNPGNYKVDFQGKIKNYLNTNILPINFQQLRLIDNLFVYSNILQDQLVGDSSSTLLRIVNLNDDKITPHYVPLKRTLIPTINIEIKDEFGKNIDFNSKIIIKLHFKK